MNRSDSLGVGAADVREALDDLILPSRKAALGAGLSALEAGPVLVTGEAGVGKTWLAARMRAESVVPADWVRVDIDPELGPRALLRAVGHGLGVDFRAADRLTLGDELAERNADGKRFGLMVDEAQLASDAVLEEIRVISNRLGHRDGFAALVLIGQTPLVRRLATRALGPLESRLAAQVHVRPLDVDEAAAWLRHARPERPFAMSEVELLHRDSGGNPRRLLREIAAPRAARPFAFASVARPTTPVTIPDPEPVPGPGPGPRPAPVPVALGGGLAAPAKPPIRLEEDLIEVGWEAEAEPASTPDEPGDTTVSADAPTEQAIEDHYAALQAWNEWTENQGRVGAQPLVAASAPFETPIELATSGRERLSGPADGPQVWLDGEESFAPYSQLFSRARQSKS